MPDAGFVAHCLELLAPLGPTRARRMFSGHGLYVDELCVALVLRDTLFLKTDETSRAAFEAAGGTPFTYTPRNGAERRTSYWTVPEAAMESPAEMRPWARRAFAAALAARARTPRAATTTSRAARSPTAATPAAAKKQRPAR